MLDTIVGLLPKSWQPKAKAILAPAVVFVGAIVTALSEGKVSLPSILLAVAAGFTALGTYFTPNKTAAKPKRPKGF